jgi:hypothetical protein
MQIKNEERFPPYYYLTQVADNCSKAVSTYMMLWRNADKEKKMSIYKKDVRSEYLISLCKFRHDLLLLVKQGLVSVDETPALLNIELVGWDSECVIE